MTRNDKNQTCIANDYNGKSFWLVNIEVGAFCNVADLCLGEEPLSTPSLVNTLLPHGD
jgi:hypothetical protein